MMKEKHFKPGDRVRALRDYPFECTKGEIGTVEEGCAAPGYVNVAFPDRWYTSPFGSCDILRIIMLKEEDLEYAGPAFDDDDGEGTIRGTSATRHIVFDITDDGGCAKYVDGKNTVRSAGVVRSKDDKPNDFNAMMYLIGKLFPECCMTVSDEREKPDAKPLPEYPGFISGTDEDGQTLYLKASAIESVVNFDNTGRVAVVCANDQYILTHTSAEEVMRRIGEVTA